MTVYDQEFLGSLLVELGVITAAQINDAIEERERTGNRSGTFWSSSASSARKTCST